MAYVHQDDKNTGDLVTAADWNQLLANDQYLAAGNYVVQEPSTAADYSTTSTTPVDVDATEWSVSITTSEDATAVKIWAQFDAQSDSASNQILSYDFTRDGTRIFNTDRGFGHSISTAAQESFHVVAIDTGITPGNTHEYRLQYWNVGTSVNRINIDATNSLKFLLVAEEM